MNQIPLPRQPLMRAPALSLVVETGGVVLTTRDGQARFDDLVLRILDCFSAPHTMEEALTTLWREEDGAMQWMRLSSAILSLRRCGALVSPDDEPTVPLVEGFAAARIHVAMLNDRPRTSAYLTAIANVVHPGDVVVDLGTGTGILALAAARAGARVVYAIESSAIAEAAEAMFEQNGFADRIHLIRGWSTEITLPQRANVLVTETLGSDPFGEHVAEFTADARARLLTADARIIPRHVRMWALPVSVPQERVDALSFTPAQVSRWHHDYGFDFDALLTANPVRPLRLQLSTNNTRDLPPLAEAVVVADIDVTRPFTSMLDKRCDVVATQSGRLNGLVIYFDLSLSPGVSMTTDPRVAEDTNSWGNSIVVLATPRDIKTGDTLSLHLDRLEGRLRADCHVT